MVKQSSDHKLRGHGQQGRPGLVHHCATCKRVGNERCFEKGHFGYCEAANCGHLFRGKYGCNKHCYAEGYNLAHKAKLEGTTLEEEVDKKVLELPELELENKSMEEKMAGLRKNYKHAEQDGKSVKAEEPEKPAVSKTQQKKEKRMGKLAAKATKR